jgi:hypothetical protein
LPNLAQALFDVPRRVHKTAEKSKFYREKFVARAENPPLIHALFHRSGGQVDVAEMTQV